MPINKVLTHFLSGSPLPAHSWNRGLYTTLGGHVLYAHGPDLVLAVMERDGCIWVNSSKVRRTTVRHRAKLIKLVSGEKQYSLTLVDDETIKLKLGELLWQLF